MLAIKIITYLFAFLSAIGQFILNYVIKDRESILFKRTRIGLFITLFASILMSIGLLWKEDTRANSLDNQVKSLSELILNKDNNSLLRDQKAQADRDKLLIEINELNTKFEPFINLAKQRYPHDNVDVALKFLISELKEVKELARPNTIKLDKYEFKKNTTKSGDNYIVKVRFKTEKNTPLGQLQFYAAITPGSDSKILDFWPSRDSSAFEHGKDSKFIMPDGQSARLIYALLGFGYPTIDITITKLTPIIIWGNNGLNSFIINPVAN